MANDSTPPAGAAVYPTPSQTRRRWRRSRQYGGAPIIAKAPGRPTVSGARFALFFTVAAWLAYLIEQVLRLSSGDVTTRNLAETAVYLALMTMLTASACAYLLARLGYFERIRTHQRVPRSTIDDLLHHTMPTMTVVVPSTSNSV